MSETRCWCCCHLMLLFPCIRYQAFSGICLLFLHTSNRSVSILNQNILALCESFLERRNAVVLKCQICDTSLVMLECSKSEVVEDKKSSQNDQDIFKKVSMYVLKDFFEECSESRGAGPCWTGVLLGSSTTCAISWSG